MYTLGPQFVVNVWISKITKKFKIALVSNLIHKVTSNQGGLLFPELVYHIFNNNKSNNVNNSNRILHDFSLKL